MSNDNPMLDIYEANLAFAFKVGDLMNTAHRQLFSNARLQLTENHAALASEMNEAVREWQQTTCEAWGTIGDTLPLNNAWSEYVKQVVIAPASFYCRDE